MHRANHTENQQHAREDRDYDAFGEIQISELLVATIWKNEKQQCPTGRQHSG